MHLRGDSGMKTVHRTVVGTEISLPAKRNAGNFKKILENPVNCLTWGEGKVVYDGS